MIDRSEEEHDLPTRARLPLPAGTFAGVVIAIVAIAALAASAYRAVRVQADAAGRVSHTLQLISDVESVGSRLKDAETGQRGYLLTGDERYLEPYAAATEQLPIDLQQLSTDTAGSSAQAARVQALTQAADARIDLLRQAIDFRRSGNAAKALALVQTDRGKALMDRVRDLIGQIVGDEEALLSGYQTAWERSRRDSVAITLGGTGVLFVLVIAGSFVMARDFRLREQQVWLRAGQAGLTTRIQGEQRIAVLGEQALDFLAHYVGADVAALYVAEADGSFHRAAAYALPPGQDADTIRPGDGLTGQAVKSRRPLIIRDVPADYLPVKSSLGRGTPTELLITPILADGVVHGVIELGFFRRIDEDDEALMAGVAHALAIAVRTALDRQRLEELLEETQRQAEELQTQQEELRVSNEELEEQGRVLRDSQARLEAQQVDLEEVNAQLEEQTQALEQQKEDLADAQLVLSSRAAELERANQYKSEFLANMSHELRTPLNSTLILATLLAENREGNLTADQVNFARTIISAGKDLLTLINEILDLSKIAAGRVDLAIDSVAVSHALGQLDAAFRLQAEQKGLSFSTSIAPGTPERFDTDAQRLGQILRNLLSNAVKFTETGGVSVDVSSAGNQISFAVRDTGIGIESGHHEIIFDAFRQADGSTHRRYGGTGLGLSISRDLARLLGGEITVASVVGKGSVFTLTLPVHRGAADAIKSEAPPPALAPRPAAVPARPPADDRALVDDKTRVILVVEDDGRFADILRDLAHELGFKCVIEPTAAGALATAARLRPSAILLDVNLPDNSGLSVLDRLKRDPHTRHIPVHIVSVADYTQQALQRGAVGFALKPVRRDQLVDAFRRLESKFTQRLRRVLVVEDDERQRDSISSLLSAPDVEIVAVPTAAQALASLRAGAFDCMVMDLSLPDMSGYELLDHMAALDDVPFPPVIVYTGRSLTRDEEDRLSRFSRSIIIKDARSPERLLDEVTLFLHQVESQLPPERQRMLRAARNRDSSIDGRRILVVEDDARNVFAVTNVLEPKGAVIQVARNGREALDALDANARDVAAGGKAIDLVLMDIMMPEMDGITATREIRKRPDGKRLPIIALTAKAMKDDQEKCLAAGANDYIAKPLDVEKLLSLVRVWMPK